MILYSVFTNFRLELTKPSARDVEGQQFYLRSEAVSSLARSELSSALNRPRPPCSLIKINTSLADGSKNSNKLVDTL